MKQIDKIVKDTAKKHNIQLTDEQIKVAVNTVEYWDSVFHKEAYDLTDVQKWNWLKFNLNKAAKGNWDFSFNFETIKDLFHYFNRSTETTLDLNKGIFLTGSYGIGKTTLLRAFFEVPFGNQSVEQFIFNKTKRISCINVVQQYSKDQDNIWKYMSDHWLFDDLGREPAPMYAKANASPLFTTIIESRYNSDQKLNTFYTSNLSLDDIKQKYTARIESILHETCNIVHMSGDDFRKK